MFIKSDPGKALLLPYIMLHEKAHVNHLFYSLLEIRPVLRKPVELCQTTVSICGLSFSGLTHKFCVAKAHVM